MRISGLIWLDEIVEKLIQKHQVSQDEIREILNSKPYFRFVERGDRKDEDVYSAMAQTSSGRYLIVYFIYKKNEHALVLSARDMKKVERNLYEKR